MALAVDQVKKFCDLFKDIVPAKGVMVSLSEPDTVISREYMSLILREKAISPGIDFDAHDKDVAAKTSEMFRCFGFSSVLNLQASSPEAPLFLDLNVAQTPEDLLGTADVVLDHATLEHVFNIPNALSHIWRMLKPGGYVVHHLPCNNEFNHGYYQISPTLLYLYYKFNKYDVVMCELDTYKGMWYETGHTYRNINSPSSALFQYNPTEYSSMFYLVAKKGPDSTNEPAPMQWGAFALELLEEERKGAPA